MIIIRGKNLNKQELQKLQEYSGEYSNYKAIASKQNQKYS